MPIVLITGISHLNFLIPPPRSRAGPPPRSRAGPPPHSRAGPPPRNGTPHRSHAGSRPHNRTLHSSQSMDWDHQLCVNCLPHAGWLDYQYVNTICPDGSKCTNKDPEHYRKNIHKPSSCEYGAKCTRKHNYLHWVVFHANKNSNKCVNCYN